MGRCADVLNFITMRLRNPKRSLLAKPADYRLLGLRHGECSSTVIRNSVRTTTHRLAESEDGEPTSTTDRDLARVATAGYRLLDPRYRRQSYERVQLCYSLEREDQNTKPIDGQRLMVPSTAIMATTAPPATEARPMPKRRRLHRDHRQNRRLRQVIQQSPVDHSRDAVRWIRESEHLERVARPHWLIRWRERCMGIFVRVVAWRPGRRQPPAV